MEKFGMFYTGFKKEPNNLRAGAQVVMSAHDESVWLTGVL